MYVALISYAIVKHRLMDIRIYIRRAALSVGIYGLLILVGGGVVYTVHTGSSRQMNWMVLFEGLTLVVILSIGPFLYAYFVKRSSYFHEHEMAGLTHDLKSPLGSINGALDQLADLREGRAVRGKDVEYIHMIRRNASRIEEAVNNLLTAFKIPTKIDAFDGKPHDIGEVVRFVVDGFRESIDAKGLKMELSVPLVGPVIHCDEIKIRQVVSNLLSNAIKYTRIGSIHVDVEEKDSVVLVTIRDTGEGIPDNELSRVFDRLFQGETSQKLKGSGLGLTIARTWIEAHGGEIHVESDGIGKGCRFWFTIPI
ncbi:hypothetical protein BVX98_05155 [bacterium F11]|nr:hypothetical protein BVX98_05155 [bacterium F11]